MPKIISFFPRSCLWTEPKMHYTSVELPLSTLQSRPKNTLIFAKIVSQKNWSIICFFGLGTKNAVFLPRNCENWCPKSLFWGKLSHEKLLNYWLLWLSCKQQEKKTKNTPPSPNSGGKGGVGGEGGGRSGRRKGAGGGEGEGEGEGRGGGWGEGGNPSQLLTCFFATPDPRAEGFRNGVGKISSRIARIAKIDFRKSISAIIGFQKSILGFGAIRLNPSNPIRPQKRVCDLFLRVSISLFLNNTLEIVFHPCPTWACTWRGMPTSWTHAMAQLELAVWCHGPYLSMCKLHCKAETLRRNNQRECLLPRLQKQKSPRNKKTKSHFRTGGDCKQKRPNQCSTVSKEDQTKFQPQVKKTKPNYRKRQRPTANEKT